MGVGEGSCDRSDGSCCGVGEGDPRWRRRGSGGFSDSGQRATKKKLWRRFECPPISLALSACVSSRGDGFCERGKGQWPRTRILFGRGTGMALPTAVAGGEMVGAGERRRQGVVLSCLGDGVRHGRGRWDASVWVGGHTKEGKDGRGQPRKRNTLGPLQLTHPPPGSPKSPAASAARHKTRRAPQSPRTRAHYRWPGPRQTPVTPPSWPAAPPFAAAW